MDDIVGHTLTARGWTVATAESYTGGLLGARLTRPARPPGPDSSAPGPAVRLLLDDPGDRTHAAMRPIRDDIEARVRALLYLLGVTAGFVARRHRVV